MVVLKVTKEFTLGEFHKLKNIVRANPRKCDEGRLYVNDEFECDKEMADYIRGKNRFKESYADIVKIIPEIKPKQPKISKTKKLTK